MTAKLQFEDLKVYLSAMILLEYCYRMPNCDFEYVFST